jgi:hypothetical protein
MYHDPNLQVGMEGNQIWGGMKRRLYTDSHDSDQIPTLQFKICPLLSEFTTSRINGNWAEGSTESASIIECWTQGSNKQ